MNIINNIKSLNFFKTLNDKQIELLSSMSMLNSYGKDYILYYEKNQSTQLLFLIEGQAKSYKIDKHENEIFLYFINQNNILSEVSTINDATLYSYSNITFIEDSKVLSIDYKKFQENFLHKNILNNEFINEIILRSQKLESLINREFIFDAVAKVAMMISSDLVMFNKLKRHDISLILHIQPATLSRVLNRLKRNDIIDIIHGKVSILNKEDLDLIYKEL
ncbi:MAG: Crp/Fnr family transcriptional regulator [Arcobacteraceae bacterium]|nr:Crp/Fnr family transcriptional regulator [Arcobacteraceae bacterium]